MTSVTLHGHFPSSTKSECHLKIKHFIAHIHTQFNLPLLSLQTDNGREFDNKPTREFLSSLGVSLRFFCPYTSPQNSRVERILRTINDTIRTLLLHAHMPPFVLGRSLEHRHLPR